MWQRKLNWMDPLTAADRLSSLKGFVFLDSALSQAELGRYSYIAVDPFALFTVIKGTAYWNGKALEGDPLQALKTQLSTYKLDVQEKKFPFQGGCIGYIGYDYAQYLEKIKDYPQSSENLVEITFGFYDAIVAFDNLTQESYLLASGFPETEPEKRAERATQRLDQLTKWLNEKLGAPREEASITLSNWHSNFTQTRYIAAIEQVKEYIRQGDIYQANIAQKFTAKLPDNFNPWRLYTKLRTINPAPFAAFLSFTDLAIASASPERFIRLQGTQVEVRPIKGTAARANDSQTDKALADILLHSEKDRAENIMIVDLLRNDLSRSCIADSVEVTALCQLESYTGVHHLVSVVTGILKPELDGLDLLKGCFPGGSITGAPKIRAMEIIAETEKACRGVYCGAIGYIDFDGDFDFNIAIRTITFSEKEAVFQAGGGITLLSDPEAEYSETLTKVDKIFESFGNPLTAGR